MQTLGPTPHPPNQSLHFNQVPGVAEEGCATHNMRRHLTHAQYSLGPPAVSLPETSQSGSSASIRPANSSPRCPWARGCTWAVFPLDGLVVHEGMACVRQSPRAAGAQGTTAEPHQQGLEAGLCGRSKVKVWIK